MIFILLGMAMILLIVLGLHREWLDRYRKSSRGIRNHDPQFREFHYRTSLPIGEVRDRLLREFRVPFTKYRFDPDMNRITFYSDMANGSIPMSFFVHLTARETGTAIRVVRADRPYGDLLYPMMQNEFWQQLAEAEPVPYEEGSHDIPAK